jgi:putative flippase GtrA
MRLQTIGLNEDIRRGLLFLFAGGTGFILYLCISNGLHYIFEVSETSSAIAGTLLPILPTFWMQRRLTFRSEVSSRLAFPRYVMLQVANAGFIIGVTALAAHTKLSGAVVFFIAGATGTLISYIVQLKFVFRGR